MFSEFISSLIAITHKARVLDSGQFLFHAGDTVQSLYIVTEGCVELKRPQEDGAIITLQRARDLSILAEASIYSDYYHCDAVAASKSIINEISKNDLLRHLTNNSEFSAAWSAYLAHEVQSARYRSEILSKKTVAERLGGWLIWQNKDLPPKGEWKNIAFEIGVSPEALYREIAKRRDK